MHGKGDEDDAVPIHPAIEQLRRGYPSQGYWFPSRDGRGHVRPNSVSATISRAFRKAGYPVTAHQLRHWFGTHAQRVGKDVRVTQELMRHRSIQSTQGYTKVSSQRKSETVRRLALGQRLHLSHGILRVNDDGRGQTMRAHHLLAGALLMLGAATGCGDDQPGAAATSAPSTSTSRQATGATVTIPGTPTAAPSMQLVPGGKWYPIPVAQCLQKVWDDRVGEWNRLTTAGRRGYDSFEAYAKGVGWQTTLKATVSEPAIVKACTPK